MGPTRRTFLQATGCTALVATSGCLDLERIPFVGGGSSNDDEPQDTSSTDDSADDGSGDDSSNNNNNNSDSDSDGNRSDDGREDASQEDNDTAEEGNQSEEEERQAEPDEEDTEIDRDQYEQSEPQEVTERPASDVTLTAEYSVSDDGSVTTRGTAKNVSSDPIDFVDIEIIYFNKSEEEIGSDLTVVRNLDAGASGSFTVQTMTTELDGDVARVGGVPTPQDYADQ